MQHPSVIYHDLDVSYHLFQKNKCVYFIQQSSFFEVNKEQPSNIKSERKLLLLYNELFGGWFVVLAPVFLCCFGFIEEGGLAWHKLLFDALKTSTRTQLVLESVPRIIYKHSSSSS